MTAAEFKELFGALRRAEKPSVDPYRQIDPAQRRHAAISAAVCVRDALHAAPRVYNITPGIASSQEIIDALTRCITELSE